MVGVMVLRVLSIVFSTLVKCSDGRICLMKSQLFCLGKPKDPEHAEC